MNGKIEYGDYQTPLEFAQKVCLFLRDIRGIKPTVVIEPTCGIGNFIQASLLFDATEYYGVEINSEYCDACKNNIHDARITIMNADFFSFNFKALTKDDSRVLILGNPPWATNSTLSSLDSCNLPIKTNFKGLRGIDAITGASNFDICEYMILHLVNEYIGSDATICMLCKTSVARNVFREIKRNHISFKTCHVFEFDAQKTFGVNVSACVLLIELSKTYVSTDVCNVYAFESPTKIKSQFGFHGGLLYNGLCKNADNFDGHCEFEWRQGVKHDCSKVMELRYENGRFQSDVMHDIDIESDLVFPLVKSSMFKKPIINEFSKYVIVTQKKSERRLFPYRCQLLKHGTI